MLYSQQTFVLIKTSWRRLSSSSSQDVFKTSWSRRICCLALRLQKTSSRTSWLRPIYFSWPYVFKTSSRCFKTSSRRLKVSCQDVFKKFSRHLQDFLQRYLQDVFKTYYQVNPFLLTRLREIFNTFLRRSFPKAFIYRGICLGNTTSEKFMVSV